MNRYRTDNVIEALLDRIAEWGEDGEMMRASIEHLLGSIEFQIGQSNKKGMNVPIVPKNIEDIEVGDMVYVNLEINYPQEMWYGHWCYVLKDAGSKFLIIPSTSHYMKGDDGYHMVIDTVINNAIGKSRLSFTDMRFIDKQRIDDRKSIGKVLTPKREIRERVFTFLHN